MWEELPINFYSNLNKCNFGLVTALHYFLAERQTDRHSFLAYANLLRSLSDKQKKNKKHRDIEERRKVDRQTEALTY